MNRQKDDRIWVNQVLSFWFNELTPQDWFKRNSAVDDAISNRFIDLPDEVAVMSEETHLASSRNALAAIICLDQFPRNLYRGDARAFATDALARQITQKAVAQEFDRELSTNEKLFMYLPLEHSEALEDQQQSVALIAKLQNDDFTQYAEAHRDVILKFGRFPHRNASLGRVSTADEEAYLNEPNSGF